MYKLRLLDIAQGMVAIFVSITECTKRNFKEILTLILGNRSLVMSLKKERVENTDSSHIQ